jgi:drug/metabolite transporter (DMT)-like permease
VLHIVFLEHLIAFIIITPFIVFKKTFSLTLFKEKFLVYFFIGFFGSALATAAFTLSYKYINPSVTIILQKLQPIISILLAHKILKEPLTKNLVINTIIALVGSILLALPEIQKSQINLSILGISLALFATFCWGASTVAGKLIPKNHSNLVSTYFRFLYGFIGLSFILITTKNLNFNLLEIMNYKLNFLYISIISGFLALNFYYSGLKKVSATTSSLSELSFPIFSIFINWIYLNKPLSISQILGTILILLAIYQIQKPSK